jgi:hypothetical protein
MGELAFRSGHSLLLANFWRAAALAMALPAIMLGYSPVHAGQQIPGVNVTVADFLADPTQILQQNPKGGSRLSVEVRDLVMADPATLQSIPYLIANADKDQKIAIAAGLARAAEMAHRTNPGYAKEIQQAVAETFDQQLMSAYDAAVAAVVGKGPVAEGALPRANGTPPGAAVEQTTAASNTVVPTISVVPPPFVPASPAAVSALAVETEPALASAPTLPPPLESTAAAVSTPAIQSALSVQPAAIVAAPAAALTEIVAPATSVVSSSAVLPPLALSVEAPLALSSQPQALSIEPLGRIGESVSPSY